MKAKLKLIGLSFAIALSSFLLVFGISGNEAYAENHSYDGKSPYYNNCASSAIVKDRQWIDSISYVELKYSTTCKTAWAKVTITRPAVANQEADARIVRSTDGKNYTCNSSGGNGVVNRGQTTCYTAMVYDYHPRSSQAQGIHMAANSDAYNYGETIWY